MNIICDLNNHKCRLHTKSVGYTQKSVGWFSTILDTNIIYDLIMINTQGV